MQHFEINRKHGCHALNLHPQPASNTLLFVQPWAARLIQIQRNVTDVMHAAHRSAVNVHQRPPDGAATRSQEKNFLRGRDEKTKMKMEQDQDCSYMDIEKVEFIHARRIVTRGYLLT